MTIYSKIRDEKLQYDINREAAKISALSPVKISIGNSDRKRFNDFNKGIKLLEKIRSGEMKIEEGKKK